MYSYSPPVRTHVAVFTVVAGIAAALLFIAAPGVTAYRWAVQLIGLFIAAAALMLCERLVNSGHYVYTVEKNRKGGTYDLIIVKKNIYGKYHEECHISVSQIAELRTITGGEKPHLPKNRIVYSYTPYISPKEYCLIRLTEDTPIDRKRDGIAAYVKFSPDKKMYGMIESILNGGDV